MRSLKSITAAFALVLGFAFIVNAGNTDKMKSSDGSKELKQQTNCPVMGGKIDSTAYTDIQGQRVYHCCPACSAKLKADPDKYFQKAAKEGVLFENIQTTCPVTGEKLEDKSTYVDYQGRRIYFCCNKCVTRFNEDPQKYLGRMDEGSEAQPDSVKDMDMDHAEHGEHH